MRAKGEGEQKMRWFDSITDSMDMNLSKPWEIVKDREGWHAAVHAVPKSQTRLSDCTTTTMLHCVSDALNVSNHILLPTTV